MAEVISHRIYGNKLSIDLAAIADDDVGYYLYTQEEWAEGAKPNLYFDCQTKTIKARSNYSNPKKWFSTGLTGEDLSWTSRELTDCTECQALVWERISNPGVDDEDGWAQVALEHDPECDWVSSRGFRLN